MKAAWAKLDDAMNTAALKLAKKRVDALFTPKFHTEFRNSIKGFVVGDHGIPPDYNLEEQLKVYWEGTCGSKALHYFKKAWMHIASRGR